jgi:hypothetical protein
MSRPDCKAIMVSGVCKIGSGTLMDGPEDAAGFWDDMLPRCWR